MAAEELAAEAAAFDRAWRARDGVTSHRAFGGLPLAVRAVGARLASTIDRSLLRASAASGQPVLRADVWTATESRPTAPALELGMEERAVGAAGERIAASGDGRAVRFAGPGYSLWLDVPERRVVGWVAGVDSLPPWQRMRPFAAFLGPWFSGTGRRIVHASALATGAGGVVLPGGDGIGKSTTALAGLRAGMSVLADDVVAIEPGACRVHTLYTTIKLRVPVRDLLGVEEHGDEAGGREWVVHQREAVVPSRLLASAPLVAIALPRLGPVAASAMVPAGPAEVTRTLLAADQMRDGRLADAFAVWSTLAERVPAARLHVGRDPDGIASVIAALADEAAVRAPAR